MLWRTIAVACVAMLLSGQVAHAARIEGVDFAPRFAWRGQTLELTGVGLLRYRIFIKGYVAALYLGEQVEPDRVLDDVPRRLEIEYFWSIPADAFARATIEGISRNVAPQRLERLREPIEQLNALYQDVEPGDRYSLTYVPGIGTELARNGEPLGIVPGAEFSKALFAIWLGEEALDEPLREQLLARR